MSWVDTLAERYPGWSQAFILGDEIGGLSLPQAMQYRARALRAAGYWTVAPQPPVEDQWRDKQAAWRASRASSSP